MENNLSLPSAEDIVLASKRIADYVCKTPVLVSPDINDIFNADFFFKCENLQITGAFKFRGAFNALANLKTQEKKLGVITFSSGNHAQAIAKASEILGIKSTILMPTDAPKIKIYNTKKYKNCNIILYDRYNDDREQILDQLVKKTGAIPISSYNNNDVIAGSGTVVKELFEEVHNLDAVFMGVGGGGLLSGSSLYIKEKNPLCDVYGVEPINANDGQISLKTGILTRISTPQTIADGAQTQSLGEKNFYIIQKYVKDILTVSDSQLIESMSTLANKLKMIVEPTGCLGFAAIQNIKNEIKNKRIGIIITGGNIDLINFIHLIQSNV
ncbi:pyridoxal-phosphate dependent enzyme [Candidatus Kinetoplastidibacterium crithidiae]|uniref:Threonine dehydratase n=1 Tax=Candidatus Kinetoplastidibacterium crithidiae TCC036E TaxID=1208918 RepID=M1LVU8_9PROT|nr:pyridoxal-phosphate dependent enzyme [Candidatus Kinetoplastibacterium crithidii]AFZ83107.1 threonine dehydratase [Candidatus Kinetoplastibacterium crithidii (ex Angomonas deanei ATCC 30255)]AGF47384.1 threonine dehydratase [Candidatus Kinetoplastibacterium crithidii TCC036E]